VQRLIGLGQLHVLHYFPASQHSHTAPAQHTRNARSSGTALLPARFTCLSLFFALPLCWAGPAPPSDIISNTIETIADDTLVAAPTVSQAYLMCPPHAVRCHKFLQLQLLPASHPSHTVAMSRELSLHSQCLNNKHPHSAALPYLCQLCYKQLF
jgi:hypothetical protein